MRKFYLASAILVFLLVLIISFAQVGATCTWFLIKSTSPAFLVLLQTAGLGAIMGGLLVLWWKFTKVAAEGEDEDEDEGGEEGGVE